MASKSSNTSLDSELQISSGQVGMILNPIRNKMKRDLEDVVYLDILNEVIGDQDDDSYSKIKSEE